MFSQFPVGCEQFRLFQFQQLFSGQSSPPFGCDFISETHFYRLVPVHRISVKIADSGEYPLNHDQLFGLAASIRWIESSADEMLPKRRTTQGGPILATVIKN